MQKSPDRFRTFIVLWLTQTVSQLGSSMTGYALVLWVYQQTQTALSVSLLTFCTYVPYVLVSLFAGGFVDRHRKKSIMLCADSIAFLCSLTVVVLLVMGKLAVPVIYVVNTITGLMNAFQSPASAVFNGLLVPEDKITRMSGLQSISGSAVMVFTPVIAAFLMSTFGIGCVLAVDMISFLFAAFVLLFFIKVPEDIPQKAAVGKQESPLAGVKEGFAFLKGHQVVLVAVLSLSVLNFFSRISYENILSPMILSRSGSQQVLGLVSGVMGLGGIVGGLIATRLPKPRDCAKRIYFMALVSFIFGDLLMGTGRSPVFWVIAALGGSVPIPLLDSGYYYLFYTRVPKEIQGRVFSVRNMLQFASIPVGLFLGGILADYVFEPLMAGSSSLQQALSAIVGTGAGSGMAVMFLMTGTLGIATSFVGYFVMKHYSRE